MKIINYDDKQFKEYKSNLQLIGTLSLLFSDNSDPWLDYRVPENLYCDSFGAENLARSCVTADAKLENIGVGIKTFLEGNKRTWQKIAEFNKARSSYANLDDIDMIKKIAELRNERIDSTMATYGLDNIIYHCVIRNSNGFHFYEEKMKKIDIDNIKILKSSSTSIIFTDNINEYNFNISKSVLQKRFIIDSYFDDVSVHVAENPLSVLKNGMKSIVTVSQDEVAVIPLYSEKNGVKFVYPKSGLNQWNAGGRVRNNNEVYIPFNKDVRDKYKNFFPNKDTSFNVTLPNGKNMSMKLCQENSKAIMSNPNSDLGEWLLREVLRLDENEVLTYEKLAELGIENVVFEKEDDYNYRLNFSYSDSDSNGEQ